MKMVYYTCSFQKKSMRKRFHELWKSSKRYLIINGQGSARFFYLVRHFHHDIPEMHFALGIMSL
jgi:hypothetical protein